jgi:glutaredoxin-related protein
MLDDQTKSRIESEISSQDVVLFMKGTPVFPAMRVFSRCCWRINPSERSI